MIKFDDKYLYIGDEFENGLMYGYEIGVVDPDPIMFVNEHFQNLLTDMSFHDCVLLLDGYFISRRGSFLDLVLSKYDCPIYGSTSFIFNEDRMFVPVFVREVRGG